MLVGAQVLEWKYSLDDGWQEQGKAVDRTEASHADEHEDVDLPVFDGLPDVFGIKVIREVPVILIETALDFLALFCGQESSTVRFSLVKALVLTMKCTYVAG